MPPIDPPATASSLAAPGAKPGDTVAHITADGRLSFATERGLTFGTGGQVAKVSVSELDRVKKGQVLASLDTTSLDQAAKTAEFGVTAAAPVAMMAAPAAAQAKEEAAEKTEFDVILTGFGANKIQVIKVVRELTGLGLKEAKDLVEGVPKPVKEAIAKKDAEGMKKKIEDVGGTADIK